MKHFRTIFGAFLTAMVAVALLVAFGGTAHALDQNGNDWGAPPYAPFFSDDGTQLCIDPPTDVTMTLVTNLDGVESQVSFPYVYTEGNHFACTDFPMPVCPAKHFEAHGVWTLGTGVSPSLELDIDQTNCPPPPVTVCRTGTTMTIPVADRQDGDVDGECPIPVVTPPVVTEVAAPAPVVSAPVCTAQQVMNGLVPVGDVCELPHTGKSSTLPLTAIGVLLGLLGLGVLATRALVSGRTVSTRGLS